MLKKLLFGLAALVFITACQEDESVLPEPNKNLNRRAVGESATELVSNANYRSAVVELQYMEGYRPEDATINYLYSFLEQTVEKPGGIEIQLKEIPVAAKATFTKEDIAAIEKQYRTVYNEGSRLGIYVFFAGGAYSTKDVLGIAYWNTSIALFGETIHEHSGGLTEPSRDKLESTVLTHEFGHLMGLVNVGAEMQAAHEDGEHKGHCNNEECLMYYAAETTDIVGRVGNSAPPTFDDNCFNDLQALK